MSGAGGALPSTLSQSEARLRALFDKCADVRFRTITIGRSAQALLVFVDGLVQSAQLEEYALLPLLTKVTGAEAAAPAALAAGAIALSHVGQARTFDQVVTALLNGNAVLLIEGNPTALLLDVKGSTRRGVEEPVTEASIRGPREGFIENLRTNTALVRARIKSADLKFEPVTLGRRTHTHVELAYMAGLVDPKVLQEAQRRLLAIDMDAVLESGYIEEMIEDDPFSPFPQLQYSERPDTVAANLLEGRFAIFVDGTPFVIMGPTTFWQMLQASEDYYERWVIGTFLRWLRFIFLFVALYMPSIYIAVTTIHHDMLPTTLLLSVAAAREPIPFPALVEGLMMEITFEALREASVRLPKSVGQAVSVLGALVIGQAAVQAGIVSAPMVIIVSVTGIASFTLPRFNAAISIRLLRFPMMLLAGAFGVFGMVVGTFLIALHMCSLRSFGVPYLSGYAPMQRSELKDILLRAPWWSMLLRPRSVSHRDRRRVAAGQMPAPPSERR